MSSSRCRPGVSYPLKLRRFYVAETKADASYTSEILIDELVAKVPPSVETPQPAKVADPVVRRRTVAGQPWRFAVMSDAQFVARDPGQRHRRQGPPHPAGGQGGEAGLPGDQR